MSIRLAIRCARSPRHRLLRAGITFLAVALAIVAARTAAAQPRATSVVVSFVDVGQGDGVVMRIGGKVIVSDTGQLNFETVTSALHQLGATDTIDVLILTHPHSDHIKNTIDLISDDHWKIKTLVINHSKYWNATPTNKKVLKAAKTAGATIVYAATGDHFGWGGADWDILNPASGKYEDPYSAANSSIAYILRVRKTNILFTGDIGPTVAKNIAATWTSDARGRVDIFLATHHGSASGSNPELLAATRPKWAVLSTGKNAFHHPTKQAIKRLEAIGASIWCTDTNGTITATISQTGGVRWHAARQPVPWWSAKTHTETGHCVNR